MADLGIFDDVQEKWVQFDEDTEVLIRFVDRETLDRITRKSDKAARMSGSDDRKIFNKLLAEAAVHGWRNIDNHDHPGLRVNRQPLLFTPENRDMLMKRSNEFAGFVNTTCINSRLYLEEDEARKNG